MGRFATVLTAVTAAFLLHGAPAHAGQPAIDFSQAGRIETYRDLPGVLSPEEVEARREPVECVRIPSRRPLSGKWRPNNAVYSCRQGNLTFETNQLPYSREREMRGIGW